MPSVAELLERESTTVDLEPGDFERLLRRRDRKQRNQRIGAAALAIILALVSFVALSRAFGPAERPADEPTPKPQGIFSEVGGWIVYGDRQGIWAVDPSHPDHSGRQIHLSTDNGTPLAWSSDGSRLLILRNHKVPHQAFGSNLFVLNADGTETTLDGASTRPHGGSSRWLVLPGRVEGRVRDLPSIYVVDSHGGRHGFSVDAGGRGPRHGCSSFTRGVNADVLTRRDEDRLLRWDRDSATASR